MWLPRNYFKKQYERVINPPHRKFLAMALSRGYIQLSSSQPGGPGHITGGLENVFN